MKIIKIRKIGTNKFSTGGVSPLWKEGKGKIWKTVGHARAHITQIKNIIRMYPNGDFTNYLRLYLEESEIIEYILSDEISQTNIFLVK